MVFGLGEGKIELALDRTNVKFGDTINGTLLLTLHAMKHARQLRLTLYAEQLGTRITRLHGRTETKKVWEQVYTKDTILDGERDYLTGIREYKFSIQAPKKDEFAPQIKKQLIEENLPEGFVSNLVKAMAASSSARHPVRWFVSASLDIPGGLDVAKKMQISVGE